MNLRDLEYLVALADYRNFRKASEKCFVTQPTLSGQLRKLEEYLGVQLVERTRRSVNITAVGQEVVRRARLILAEAEQIEEVARTFNDPMRGKVRLGLIPTLAPYLLPAVMTTIRDFLPELELFRFEEQTHRLLERLKALELDAVILALPVESSGLETLPLFQEGFLLAIPEHHRLSGRKFAQVSDLKEESILLLEDGHCLRDQALEVCAHSGATERQGFQGTSLETLRHMVSAGMGVTLMPELAVKHASSSTLPLRYLPFEKPEPSREIGLLFRKSSRRTPCYERMAEAIRHAVSVDHPGNR
jgi:LysR family hydrogen peroxide-inducible transcriptional activator